MSPRDRLSPPSFLRVVRFSTPVRVPPPVTARVIRRQPIEQPVTMIARISDGTPILEVTASEGFFDAEELQNLASWLERVSRRKDKAPSLKAL
jgi:hypothetical protein